MSHVAPSVTRGQLRRQGEVPTDGQPRQPEPRARLGPRAIPAQPRATVMCMFTPAGVHRFTRSGAIHPKCV